MNRTVQDVLAIMTSVAHDPYDEHRQILPDDLAAQLTPGKARDWRTHAGYIAGSFGVATVAEIAPTQLTEDTLDMVDRHLIARGKGDGVRRNTKLTLKTLRSVAIALGELQPDLPVPQIPKRNQLVRREGEQVIILRPPLRKVVAPYGRRYEDFNPTLQEEVDRLKHYFTAPFVRGRRGRSIDSSTWKGYLDRLERFFGAMEKMGDSHDEARLKDFTDADCLEKYVEFFLEDRDDPTFTLKDLLAEAANIAKNYFKDKGLSDEINSMISQMRFERVKDLDDIVSRITADDLYRLGDLLDQHARAYEHRHLRRKSCAAVKYPQAQVAWHYGRALTMHIANTCWFRRANLFGIVWGQHLYLHDGKLYFKFSAKEMKSKEPHMGQVVDLWRGRAGYNQLERLLNRYLELRHHLVEKFLANHPGEDEPKQLLLNRDGRPYAPTGGWAMFSSASRSYLGVEKEIFPHAPRLIVPTYLMLEYDYAILGSIQAILDHKSIQTTERHYLRMKRLMNGQVAQRMMDERAARDRQAQAIIKMERMVSEMRAQLGPT